MDMNERQFPSQRVYTLPDFVFFNHGNHASAKVECVSCHGNVMQQEKVEIAQAMKMKWCVDCHKQRKATVTCTTCHELGQ